MQSLQLKSCFLFVQRFATFVISFKPELISWENVFKIGLIFFPQVPRHLQRRLHPWIVHPLRRWRLKCSGRSTQTRLVHRWLDFDHFHINHYTFLKQHGQLRCHSENRFQIARIFSVSGFPPVFCQEKKITEFQSQLAGGKYTSIFLRFGGGKIVEKRSMGKNYLKLSPQNLYNFFGFFVKCNNLD